MKRHNGRIIAVMTLFNMDISLLGVNLLDETFNKIVQLEKEEEYPVDIDFDYANLLIHGFYDNEKVIDKIISNSLKGYTIDRLSYVDRAIIRISVYEMVFEKIPKEVAINEAIEITKEYSSIDDSQVKFNNRLLDNIARDIYGE